MHELGTVIYVIQEVEKVVEENNLTKVARVKQEVGEVSGNTIFQKIVQFEVFSSFAASISSLGTSTTAARYTIKL